MKNEGTEKKLVIKKKLNCRKQETPIKKEITHSYKMFYLGNRSVCAFCNGGKLRGYKYKLNYQLLALTS